MLPLKAKRLLVGHQASHSDLCLDLLIDIYIGRKDIAEIGSKLISVISVGAGQRGQLGSVQKQSFSVGILADQPADFEDMIVDIVREVRRLYLSHNSDSKIAFNCHFIDLKSLTYSSIFQARNTLLHGNSQ